MPGPGFRLGMPGSGLMPVPGLRYCRAGPDYRTALEILPGPGLMPVPGILVEEKMPGLGPGGIQKCRAFAVLVPGTQSFYI